jgi:hypothetical protein
MGIDVCWVDDEQTLLQVSLSSPWNWPDLERAMDQGLEMIAPVGHTVHFLIDFTDNGHRPKGNSLMHLKRVMQSVTAHPNAGQSYMVNPNPFARSLIELLLRVYKDAQRIHMVESREEALRCIEASVQEVTAGE